MSSSDKNCSQVGPMSPDIMNFDEGGGGGGGCVNQTGSSSSPPSSLDLPSSDLCASSLPILLITANVGSIFEDPQNLIPQWLAQVGQQIRTKSPAFVAIHCQEVKCLLKDWSHCICKAVMNRENT